MRSNTCARCGHDEVEDDECTECGALRPETRNGRVTELRDVRVRLKNMSDGDWDGATVVIIEEDKTPDQPHNYWRESFRVENLDEVLVYGLAHSGEAHGELVTEPQAVRISDQPYVDMTDTGDFGYLR